MTNDFEARSNQSDSSILSLFGKKFSLFSALLLSSFEPCHPNPISLIQTCPRLLRACERYESVNEVILTSENVLYSIR